MRNLLTPAARRWLYGIALAALPLLIVYGILTETTAPLWGALAGAILVPGVAIANTPATDPPPRRGRDDDGDGQPDTL
ncbi:hypothetical protein CGZ94_04975 [Enemella evansiae]|uniref:Uncharacterized protein n=1 Tax=Enemella evansiae TaxID=2016499 RepID=A0A255GP04_9ACTN|nr:hypothetical protein [Enemella evansiae]OYO16296.1 hypothetical protein CGZ94_04975 [Enemella evansiae]